jgi:K+-sensing histidine kinase KdpD
VGIPPDEQTRIFDRFYRIDNRLRRDTQGTGLGLYLVRAIVQAHGGTIRVESQVGRGSRFLLTLPLARRQITAGQVELLPSDTPPAAPLDEPPTVPPDEPPILPGST